MGRPKTNPNSDSLIEDQDKDDQLNEADESDTQDEQGAKSSEKIDTAKVGDNGGKIEGLPFSGKVKNPALANQTVHGVTGVPIAFNGDGVAECDESEWNHFLKVPGFEAV